MSRWGRGPKLSLSRLTARGASTSPMGTFSQKIQCQLIPPAIAPPMTGPTATARPAMPPHSPIATPRFWAGKASLINVSVKGVTIAAPAPCTTRAPISALTLGESADATEPTVKIAMPIANIRRLPKRSPSAAPVRSRHANARL